MEAIDVPLHRYNVWSRTRQTRQADRAYLAVISLEGLGVLTDPGWWFSYGPRIVILNQDRTVRIGIGREKTDRYLDIQWHDLNLNCTRAQLDLKAGRMAPKSRTPLGLQGHRGLGRDYDPESVTFWNIQ